MFRDQEKYGRNPTEIRRTSDSTFYAPLRLQQSHIIFTCSWSDFFIEEADAWRADAWDVIRRTPHHIYQVLTKRPERIAQCLPPDWNHGWPHVWLGVTAENQRMANARVPILLQTPSATRWVCAEPLLGPLELTSFMQDNQTRLDWVVTGAETGPNARALDENWVRRLRDECTSAAIPLWYKQNNTGGVRIRNPRLDGKVWNQMPPLPSPESGVRRQRPARTPAKPLSAGQMNLFDEC
jgi:protein gp37